uniref:Tc1-like transposase DDE domain-containing protein n=1 Tax=Romanomermis culicivorax TaxID=13658 RepID=A0A915K9R9_ROMCU
MHTSAKAEAYYESHQIDWWKTPAESPGINPIENLWGEIKHYLRKTVKPMNQKQLVDGCLAFRKMVHAAKCNNYINHLYKVVPAVIKANGQATGF